MSTQKESERTKANGKMAKKKRQIKVAKEKANIFVNFF
jgi:hypothetical protein